MGKVKEALLDSYEVNEAVEQEIQVGSLVLVYDSKFGTKPVLGTVLYIKEVGHDRLLSVELQRSRTIVQVYDIQCRVAKKRVARSLYLKLDPNSGAVLDVSLEDKSKESETWTLFREVLSFSS